ncbi:GTPase-activating protein skywalker-like [Amphibalanus amphitrite]|uniref:GTPase-activating protein skywalker-like n=1 Tax=Amphibalanus amphitrite TaxID=1232801 RepID=UPI001C90CE03|nr:GTPase-activating protein skywalker-like [Amphibalanus amphitrite]
MSVALQVGGAPLPAGGGSGWPAERRACRAAGGQQRRAPAPPPGRRFSLITLVNVIHSDRAVFGTHSGPAPPTTPSPPRQRHKADSVGTSGGHGPCTPGAPEETAGAAYRANGQNSSLSSSPPDGSALGEATPKLSSPTDGVEAESGVDSPGLGGAPSRPLHENINQQTKRQLRTGLTVLDAAARRQLWLAVCRHHGAELENGDEYRDTVEQMEGHYGPATGPQLPRPPLKLAFYSNDFGLDAAGVWTAERILAVLAYNNPAVTYSPPLFSVCCLLLRFMDEEDAYNCLCMMLKNSKLGYLVQTKRQCEISWRTLVKLCRKHARGSMRFLQRYAGSSEAVRRLLADWMTWIFCYLPFSHVVRLFDCYLMEGEKVLYRAAMALIVLLHKQTAHQPCRDKASHWATLLEEQSVQDVMKIFCQEIPVTPRKLLKTMFTIRAFSRGTLNSSYVKAREQIRADGGRITFPEPTPADEAGCGSELAQQNLPSLDSQRLLGRSSNTIGVKELLRLWESVPARFALCSPLLLYTSSEHGFSLKTFYQRVGTFEPTVLLLRTTEGEVFGAYCSAHWNTRNQLLEDGSRHAYFGTGETFLFSLRPELSVYRWVGAARAGGEPRAAPLRHEQQLFQAADTTMLTVGGGGGGQAIWLDESLSRGRSDRCQTFANPPLAPHGSFEVACIEVFGFAPS